MTFISGEDVLYHFRLDGERVRVDIKVMVRQTATMNEN
jgi:hypothetical protein